MIPRVEIAVESDGWPEPSILAERVRFCLEAAIEEAKPSLPEGGELSVLFTDDEAMRELNARWRGKDSPTNVLSFPGEAESPANRSCASANADAGESGGTLPGGTPPAESPSAEAVPPSFPVLLGDVVLSRETLAREAERDGKSFENHMTHLIVHGLLHLFGHDHECERDAGIMESLEARILSRLGESKPC